MLTKTVQKIRKSLMKSKKFTAFYEGTIRFLYKCDPVIPQAFTCGLTYYISMGERLNLKDPRNFNEKIQWLKVNYRDSRLLQCADKYAVREFVKENGFADTLVPLIGIYDSIDDVDFSGLPEKFAMKCTNGCGSNLICQNKSELDINGIKKEFRKWAKQKIGYTSGEYHYNYIKPRIIVEQNLCGDDGILPLDYKFYCFNGEPHCVCVYADRDPVTQETRRCYFDMDWKPLDYCTERYKTDNSRFSRPQNLEYMIEIARKLSGYFPFVRVDLYEVNGHVYFGELTFTPTGGRGKAYNTECNNLMGELLKLPEASKDRKWSHYAL